MNNITNKKAKELIKKIYFPSLREEVDWSFEGYIGHNHVRYFSYARYALYEALKLINIKKGESILIPEFICKEVLSPINSLGVIPIYYPLTQDLKIKPLDNKPATKAILVINYFGMPVNLDVVEKYSHLNNSIIIEDNSHGFLSGDKDSEVLGKRTQISIFSFRKSLPISNGAALVINDLNLAKSLSQQLDYVPEKIFNNKDRLKKIVRAILNKKSLYFLFFLIKYKQLIRRYITGSEIKMSLPESEFVMPDMPNPSVEFKAYLSNLCEDEEITRRQELYDFIKTYLTGQVDAVLEQENSDFVPYCFPFRCKDINLVKRKLNKIYLSCYKWPELPEKIENKAPSYYKDVWVVPFIW